MPAPNSTFLSGVRIKKTAGRDYYSGVSFDQVIAKKVGHVTPYSSLEISCDTIRNAGACDTGYSCIYEHNLAWSSPTTPMTPEVNPRLLFERLFGAGSPKDRTQNLILRQRQQRSVLDFVAEDTRSLERQLSGGDTRKLDEFLTNVREIEERLQRVEKTYGQHTAGDAVEPVAAIPASFTEYVRLNLDMLHLAFLTDNTRVATFMISGDGNNRDFLEIGVPEGHHFCTHHRNQAELIAKTCMIDRWYVQQLAYFLNKMDQTKDVDGNSLLHNSMIIYGSGHADGNRHTHTNLPVILAGGGGGTLTPGRYVQNKPMPVTNLYLSMMDRMGALGVERLGDSTGRLSNLWRGRVREIVLRLAAGFVPEFFRRGGKEFRAWGIIRLFPALIHQSCVIVLERSAMSISHGLLGRSLQERAVRGSNLWLGCQLCRGVGDGGSGGVGSDSSAGGRTRRCRCRGRSRRGPDTSHS